MAAMEALAEGTSVAAAEVSSPSATTEATVAAPIRDSAEAARTPEATEAAAGRSGRPLMSPSPRGFPRLHSKLY